MRVLVIANNFPWPEHPFDGVFNLRALLALGERGIDARVVRCVPWAPPLQKRWQHYRTVPDRYAVDGVPVRTLRGLMGPSNWGIGTLGEQLRGRLHEEIADFRPDVVHVHGLLPAGVLALATGNVPLVLTGHGSESYSLPWTRNSLQALAQRIISRAAAVCAVSDFVGRHLRRLGAPDVDVIPNGADERIFFPQDRTRAREILNLDPQRPLVLFVGHLEREKGVTELVEALKSLRDLEAGALFAGKGALQSWAERELEAAGVYARFLGTLDHHHLAQAYAAADVFALPSYREGLPTVICEAMNAGRAVVASDVGGIPEIVESGVTGYLAPPRDARALAERVRAVLCDPERREEMERAAHARARTALTWAANARRYDAIYHRVATREVVYGKTM